MRDVDARGGNWDRAGDAIAAVVRNGGTAAFCTIGDPNLYSTFTYVAQTVRELVPDVVVEIDTHGGAHAKAVAPATSVTARTTCATKTWIVLSVSSRIPGNQLPLAAASSVQ